MTGRFQPEGAAPWLKGAASEGPGPGRKSPSIWLYRWLSLVVDALLRDHNLPVVQPRPARNRVVARMDPPSIAPGPESILRRSRVVSSE